MNGVFSPAASAPKSSPKASAAIMSLDIRVPVLRTSAAPVRAEERMVETAVAALNLMRGS